MQALQANTPQKQARAIPTHCPVCGRPVKQAARGARKYKHRNCGLIDFALDDLERRIKATKWQNSQHFRYVRRRLFQIICNCFNQKAYLEFAPDDDTEI